MWRFFSNKILRNRIVFIIIITIATLFMIYEGSKIQLSYQFAKILPSNDSTQINYENFKNKFGEDGSIMFIGFENKKLFQIKTFNDWYLLSNEIKNIKGIKDVMSVATIYNLKRNDSLMKLDFLPVIKQLPKSQKELDSIKNVILSLQFYEGIIYKGETGATLMAITFDKKDLNAKNRIDIVKKIKASSDDFSEKHDINLHYSGMPYIRTALMEKISHEMILFLVLGFIVTIIILFIFFRSFTTVLFSIIIVGIGVIWSLGMLVLFDYKITVLTGLIPPLIMVIGVPNCVFLINKYHSEFAKHKNKIKALSRMIETIGITLFLANITTAIGFAVLCFTNSSMLVEFGAIAAINVMVTYAIALILVPIFLSFISVPSEKATKHLDAKIINKLLLFIDKIVHNYRKSIYITIGIITLISMYGMTKISVIGFVVDDLPENDPVCKDLKFFEKTFQGVLPFEIIIDTKKKNGVFEDDAATLYKIKRMQKIFSEYPEFSKPLSIVEGIKFSYQAYKDGDSKYYILPDKRKLQSLSKYINSVKGQENKLMSFIDSTKQYTRVSIQMSDVGSHRTKELVNEIKPRIDSILNPADYNVTMTGHSLVYLKGNDYLLDNLFESLIIEIILIAIVGLTLFKSFRIIVLSKLPCLIPLIITAGIMGFLGIRFKPSTILIFSIAFGISSDGTIYFLSKYRQELVKNKRTVLDAISVTIKETGISMIYTAIILFFGFAIFAASSFGGTAALGVLISITLLVSMATNLILLPSLLLSIDKRINKKALFEKPFIEIDDTEDENNNDKSLSE